MTKSSIYHRDLDRNPANYAPLTPLSLIARTADIWPRQLAVVYGERRDTWADTYARSRKLASALARAGIGRGDTVAAMLSNTPEMIECHFGVPMTGGVLNTLNTRLDGDAIAFMLDHGEAKVLITDTEFSPTVKKALALAKAKPLVVDVDDAQGPGGERLGKTDYDAFIADGDAAYAWQPPADEWDAIALNYTSGTTGNPKGVVYHHRGAYLNALSNIVDWGMPRHAVYLWTLPMFHCNGWCFPWTMAANAGTNVCLRRVEAKPVLDAIRAYKVTHYCGAPIVHAMLINAPDELKTGIGHKVQLPRRSGGAAGRGDRRHGAHGLRHHARLRPDGNLRAGRCVREARRMGRARYRRPHRAQRPPGHAQHVRRRHDGDGPGHDAARARRRRDDGRDHVPRQHHDAAAISRIPRPPRKRSPAAGSTRATSRCMQPDGYVKIKDRSKDVIISGGENISSLEVEDVLYRHPAVLAAAVVAQPDPKWGETPCAFVELKPGASVSEADLIEHCRAHLARFKVPKKVIFGDLPKTSTGKIQKFMLRQRARSTSAIE